MIYYRKNGLIVRDSAAADVEVISASIRRQDAEEVLAAGFASAREALAGAFKSSTHCLTAERDGVPLAMFGLVPDALLGSRARVWMLGAVGLAQIKKTFVRVSRLVIGFLLDIYPELYNWVDARYLGAVRWLESCGAQFGPSRFAGQYEFRYFVMRRA